MIIRNIEQNDYIKYTKLINSNITQDQYNTFLSDILNDKHQIIILEENDDIIATGTLFIEDKMTYGLCSLGHIENVLVHINHRKKSLGELLVNKLLDIAKHKGCYRVDLTCNSELENFYNKNNLNKKQISMSILFEENFNT